MQMSYDLLHSIFKGILFGPVSYGWNQKSMGQGILMPEGKRWLHLYNFETENQALQQCQRLMSSNLLKGIAKPYLFETKLVQDNGGFFSVVLMDYIEDPTISKQETLTDSFLPTPCWFEKLRVTLKALRVQTSSWVSCRQDLINRRLHEEYDT